MPPRYGPDVIGGAELVLREVAHGLAARGWEVDVLTTCARDHHTWANHYPAGTTTDAKVTVRRFPVVNDTDGRARQALVQKLARGEAPRVVFEGAVREVETENADAPADKAPHHVG